MGAFYFMMAGFQEAIFPFKNNYIRKVLTSFDSAL